MIAPRSLLALRLVLLLPLLALFGSALAHAQAEPASTVPTPPPYLDEPPDVGLLPSHRAEWLAGTDAVSLFAPRVAPALGLGIEAVRAFDARQRHRVGVHLGGLLAADAETHKAALHVWPGLRYRFSFQMDDLFDWYLLGRLDFPIGSDPWRAGALSPGVGAGVRLARTAAIEAAFMLPVGLFSPIELDGTRARAWAAFGVAISVDLCRVAADCEPPEKPQEARDCTADLYQQAQGTCLGATPLQHAALCEAVMRALDGAEHFPRQGEDSTRAFLRGLLSELGDAPEQASLRREVSQLSATHARWRSLLDAQRDAARTAAQQKRTLRYVTDYAPSAVELRRVLGCYPAPGRERCPAPAPSSTVHGRSKGWTCTQ